jgi:hypothetical protein
MNYLPFPHEIKALLAILITQALFGIARADTIVIRDAKEGNIVAEVDIDAKGARFIHAGRTLTIKRKAPLMERRARSLLCPRISFREASLEEIASHLRQPNPVGKDNEDLRIPTINIVVNDQAQRNLRMSIDLEKVSLFDALASLAQKYEFKVTYDDHTITLIDPK